MMLMYKEYKMDRGVPWFIGVDKFASSLTVWGEMGWIPGSVIWKCEMVRLWNCLLNVSENLIKRFVFGFNHATLHGPLIHGVLEEVELQYGI